LEPFPDPLLLNECGRVVLTPRNLFHININEGQRGSVGGRGAMLQVRRSQARVPMASLYFPIDLIIPAALGPGVQSASNRNEYRKQKNVSGK
jgi:hypothetical protein